MNMKNIKGRRMPFENEIEYTRELMENHPDPSVEWGSGGDTIQAGTGIDITTESDDTKTISIDNTVALKTDIPSDYVTRTTDQNISGRKIFTNTDGIQSRSTTTSTNRVIIDGTDESRPYVEVQKGGSYADNLHIYSSSLDYLPANGSSNKNFQVVAHYMDDSNKKFTYEFKAPEYTDSAATFTVATTADLPASVSGTNDGTNWTTLTIGNDTYGIGGGSTPANMVTTDTEQNISEKKTIGNQWQLHENGIYSTTSWRTTGIYLRDYNRGKGVISFMNKGNSTTNPEYTAADRFNVNIHLDAGGVDSSSNFYVFDPTAFYFVKGLSVNGANLGSSTNPFRNLYLSDNISDGTNTVSVADLAALITYAKTQGWIS